jgi:hypothetical protein
MPVQAIPLALVASLYPFGLAVVLLLAEAERYKGRLTVFLAGAAICTLAIGFAVVVCPARCEARPVESRLHTEDLVIP